MSIERTPGSRDRGQFAKIEQARASPFLQETFDSRERVAPCFSDLVDGDLLQRPNMVGCMSLILEMKAAIWPKEDHDQESRLTFDEIADWRDRLKGAFVLLGTARYLWLADSLGFSGFAGVEQQ